MILDEIIEKRKIQLLREKSAAPDIKKAAEKCVRTPVNFKDALAKPDRLSVIAEIKKASPSKGLICPDFDPEKIAEEYEKCGADAVSCLTEEHYFQGSSEIFRRVREKTSLPMIRKDFIIDEFQIYEAKIMGADAILLIAAALAETHNEEELERVLSLDFEIIGINNRDLKTFDVTLETTARLAEKIPKGKIIVSESGIRNNEDMKSVRRYGADVVLIGETLMRSGSIEKSLAELRAGV